MDIKQNYDRVLLVVFGIIAIAVGALLTMKALALPDKFSRSDAPEGADYGDSGLAAVENAKAHLGKEVAWASPSMPGVPQKALPLFKSPPIWVKDGVEIDLLDSASEPMHPPIANVYLHEHGLPAGRSDLKTLDLDRDGFNTLEEFLGGKTDPNDPQDHPQFTDKLSLAEVKVDEYILEYRTSGGEGGEHGIRETTNLFQGVEPRVAPRKRSQFKKRGEAFGMHPGHEDRYQIVGFEKKQEPGGAGGSLKDADEVTIEDAKNPGNPFKLKLKTPRVISTYYAVLHYSQPGHDGNLQGYFKEGDTFELPNDPGTKYKVLELSGKPDDGVKIQKVAAPGETPKDLLIPPMQKNG